MNDKTVFVPMNTVLFILKALSLPQKRHRYVYNYRTDAHRNAAGLPLTETEFK